ncbi:hypothetical protein TRFO_25728 [Tritrichomonas foetus]|uniref:Uncharacterized protein n=1 Tax=Tritrichomonas foetus TaxID=1144522 RepID=A0A1J4K476_9EUKA|nr:hypothetical protein TRFO_25728 [Tritrichomonas foetus]|eukprot:OHT06249.1 hypothetical protein TRFO_25728 [Tritrichomonas foetus]
MNLCYKFLDHTEKALPFRSFVSYEINETLPDSDEYEPAAVFHSFSTSFESKNLQSVISSMNKLSKIAVSNKFSFTQLSSTYEQQNGSFSSFFDQLSSFFDESSPIQLVRTASKLLYDFFKSFDDIEFSIARKFCDPNIINFIFRKIYQNENNDVYIYGKLICSISLLSQEFHDIILTIHSIENICQTFLQMMHQTTHQITNQTTHQTIHQITHQMMHQIANQTTHQMMHQTKQKNLKENDNFFGAQIGIFTNEFANTILSIICDLCVFPIDENSANNISLLFSSINILELQLNDTYLIFHTIRLIIESNQEYISIFEYILRPPNILSQILQKLIDKENQLKENEKLDKFEIRIMDDICGIALCVYINKNVVSIPLNLFATLIRSAKDTTAKNALIFFVEFMSSSQENFSTGVKFEFFSCLKQALQFRNASIRIIAGHSLATLLPFAGERLILDLVVQHFFVLAFRLIDFNDPQLCHEMLHVMEMFLEKLIIYNDRPKALYLRENIIEEDMISTLERIHLDDDYENEVLNDQPIEISESDKQQVAGNLSNHAGYLIDKIRHFFIMYGFDGYYEEEEEQYFDEYSNIFIHDDAGDEFFTQTSKNHNLKKSIFI